MSTTVQFKLSPSRSFSTFSRFSLSADSPSQLLSSLLERLQSLGRDVSLLGYVDSDGDTCELLTEDDLSSAMDHFGDRAIVLSVPSPKKTTFDESQSRSRSHSHGRHRRDGSSSSSSSSSSSDDEPEMPSKCAKRQAHKMARKYLLKARLHHLHRPFGWTRPLSMVSRGPRHCVPRRSLFRRHSFSGMGRGFCGRCGMKRRGCGFGGLRRREGPGCRKPFPGFEGRGFGSMSHGEEFERPRRFGCNKGFGGFGGRGNCMGRKGPGFEFGGAAAKDFGGFGCRKEFPGFGGHHGMSRHFSRMDKDRECRKRCFAKHCRRRFPSPFPHHRRYFGHSRRAFSEGPFSF